MSILSTLAPAVAPAANSVTQSSGSASRGGDGGSAQSSNAQSVISSQAAVVSLSTLESKSRGASSGTDGRRVDAGFEKQDAQEKTSASPRDQEEEAQQKIDVSA